MHSGEGRTQRERSVSGARRREGVCALYSREAGRQAVRISQAHTRDEWPGPAKIYCRARPLLTYNSILHCNATKPANISSITQPCEKSRPDFSPLLEHFFKERCCFYTYRIYLRTHFCYISTFKRK